MQRRIEIGIGVKEAEDLELLRYDLNPVTKQRSEEEIPGEGTACEKARGSKNTANPKSHFPWLEEPAEMDQQANL
jgi:hypothetical protein